MDSSNTESATVEKKILAVRNVQRETDLVTAGGVADSFWRRFVGLMGSKELAAGDGLLIDPCSSVHCFFMSIPIDVVYLDREDRVVGVDEHLRPWRIGGFYRGAKRVLELPTGTVARTGTQIGDQLTITITDPEVNTQHYPRSPIPDP